MNFEVEAKYPISIFQDNAIPYSWNTIKVGWDLKRLSVQEIGNFALDYSESHPGLVNEYISELILDTKEYQMDDYLKKAFHSLDLEWPEKMTPIWNKEWRKWRFCIMSEMYQSIDDHEKLLIAIEGVYADFNYPSDMTSFIYYIPVAHPAEIKHLNPDQARERLVTILGTFLVQERSMIESGCDFLPNQHIPY